MCPCIVNFLDLNEIIQAGSSVIIEIPVVYQIEIVLGYSISSYAAAF